jgi:hypothetical protein
MTLLYGIQHIEGFTTDSTKLYEKDCFFFGHSFFHRHVQLDAIVLQGNMEITLCINPFSPRYAGFIQTEFVHVLQAHSSVIDPSKMETAGKCFLADCDCPRSDVGSVVGYLKRKYRLETVSIYQFPLVNCPVRDNKMN